VLPFHIKTVVDWQGGSFGTFQGGIPSVYLKNKKVITAKTGARTAIAIWPHDDGNPDLLGRKVKSWDPIATESMSNMTDFDTPYWLDEELVVPIAIRDYDFDPCD
jgi:hypothetical protein